MLQLLATYVPEFVRKARTSPVSAAAACDVLDSMMAADKLLTAVSSLGFDGSRAAGPALQKACQQPQARQLVDWIGDILQKEADSGVATADLYKEAFVKLITSVIYITRLEAPESRQ